MVDQREAVLNFITANGPVLPVQISKHVETNILFASAILAELVERKKLKITHFSIGGSPLYYLAGQEELMDKRLSSSLGGREKEAYNLIKERKVVREADLEPWQRVAIKSLKDFTLPLNVVVQGNTEVFWKHKIVSDDEAKLLIEEIINLTYGKETSSETHLQQELIKELNIEKTKTVEVQEILSQPIESKTKVENANSEILMKEIAEKLKHELLKEMKPENEIKVKEFKVKEENKQEIIKKPEIKPEGKFYDEICKFLQKNEIKIVIEEMIKKEKEFDFIVEIPSTVVNLRYFLKVKNKPSISDADVSMAFSEGKVKNLPILFLVNGKVSKKASELIDKKLKGQIILKQF